MAAGKIVLARLIQLGTIINGKTGFSSLMKHRLYLKRKNFDDARTKDEIINEAYRIVDTYSIDKFYNNILRVYKRAIRSLQTPLKILK